MFSFCIVRLWLSGYLRFCFDSLIDPFILFFGGSLWFMCLFLVLICYCQCECCVPLAE